MAKGNFTGAAASAKVIDADVYRDSLVIQMTDASAILSLGIGETAVAGEGVQLVNVGDTVHLRGPAARRAIYAIGNGGKAAYQDGDILISRGPHVAT